MTTCPFSPTMLAIVILPPSSITRLIGSDGLLPFLLRQLLQEPLQPSAEQSRDLHVRERAGAFEDGEVRLRKVLEPLVRGRDGRGLRLPAPGEPDGHFELGELFGDVQPEVPP